MLFVSVIVPPVCVISYYLTFIIFGRGFERLSNVKFIFILCHTA